MNEAEVGQLARRAIEMQKVPNRHPDRLWGGPGVGASCVICEQPVTQSEMEFEMQFKRDGHPADRVLGDAHFHVFHVHIRCFSAWDFKPTHNSPHVCWCGRDWKAR